MYFVQRKNHLSQVILLGLLVLPLFCGREALSQIPGQTAPNQGGNQGKNQSQVSGQKAPDQPNNPGNNPPQVANQKAPSTPGASDHPHTVAKAPSGPVQPMIPWDGKVADPSTVPPDFNPGTYKALQMGMMMKTVTKENPSNSWAPKITPVPTGIPNFHNMVNGYKQFQLQNPLKTAEEKQMKIFTDPNQSQAAREQALKELKEINGKMKANLDGLVKEAKDKFYQEKYYKEQMEKYNQEQIKAGKNPYEHLNGYKGKVYPGMKGHEAGAGILIGVKAGQSK